MAYILKKLNSFKITPKQIFEKVNSSNKIYLTSNYHFQNWISNLDIKSSIKSRTYPVITYCNLSRNTNFKKENGQNNGKGFLPRLFLLSLSIPFLSKSDEKEHEDDELTLTIKKSIVAMENGEFAKAEQLLHIVLKSAQEIQDEAAITFIFDIMANLAFESDQFQKAHDLFLEVLKRIMRDGTPKDHNSVVEISLKLAVIFANLNEQEKAKQGFIFCIHTQEEKLKYVNEKDVDEDTIALWAMSHDWYARYLISHGNYSAAKGHFERALEVCIKIKGENDAQTAILLNDLGTISSLQENYDEALDYFERAIKIAEINDIEDLDSFYINVANVYLFKKLFEKAYYFCKKGLNLAKKLGNDETIREAYTCLEMIKKNELGFTIQLSS